MPSGRTNNFPESGRGLGYVTPTIFGIRMIGPYDRTYLQNYLSYGLQI